MTKQNLYKNSHEAPRGFLKNLAIALAPQEEIIREGVREAKGSTSASAVDHEGKPLIIYTRSAKHFGCA